ncbi:hypothetical protein RN001_003818 [Aquatica leii]|uniref:Uncharacterized protein n=1 Tax=Aquatica leii TaxID=1421715 RepID=A0AAN7PIW0_9COLE|nr:hypothetical protein RN001_003818 [Aquatica leii]
MAQPSPIFSPQKNFKYGDTRQERPPHYKNHCCLTRQSEKKSDVYVHRFNRIPNSSNSFQRNDWRTGNQIHQNMYKHEFSDYNNASALYLKKQFDNLTLNPKGLQTNISPCKFTKSINKYCYFEKQNSKFSQSKSNGAKIHKSFLFKPENKAIVDKLEETYWSKWKPNKNLFYRNMCPKTKGLYTENEKVEVPYTPATETKERGDSNEGIAIIPHNTPNEDASVAIEPTKSEATKSEVKVVGALEEEKIEEEIKIQNLEEKDPATTETPVVENKAIILMPESPSEFDVNELKHTDSFILTAKKKSMEKSHYQQPKCIKLFKSAGYTTKASTSYIKGGSYPLKSCLKKEKNESKISCLSGHSVTPVRSTYRRPGKANRFTT